VTGDREGYLTLFLESGSGLTDEGHIKANGFDVKVTANSFPFIVDWNDDGKKDLVIGEELPNSPSTGNIRVYLNQGTDPAPAFDNYSVVYAGGSQLYRYRMNPVVYDLDADGLRDLIIGNDDGRVYFYRNIGNPGSPAFGATFDTLKTENGTPIDVVAGSRIHFVDWDGDGDLDLLISGYEGYVQLCENASGTGIKEGEHEIKTITGPVVSPNPITKTAQFAFSLQTSTNVRIDIYSVDGRLVSTPLDQYTPSGERRFSWNATDDRGRKLPSGIYLVRITTDKETNTTSVVITR
jgi:hypothetical protein